MHVNQDPSIGILTIQDIVSISFGPEEFPFPFCIEVKQKVSSKVLVVTISFQSYIAAPGFDGQDVFVGIGDNSVIISQTPIEFLMEDTGKINGGVIIKSKDKGILLNESLRKDHTKESPLMILEELK